jgi:hypothetical protein
MLTAATDHHCHQANIAAHGTAQLTELVRQFMVAYSGVEAEPRALQTYMPYPDWQPAGAAAPPRPPGPSAPTEDVLRKLFATRRIPPHVFRDLMSPAKETS